MCDARVSVLCVRYEYVQQLGGGEGENPTDKNHILCETVSPWRGEGGGAKSRRFLFPLLSFWRLRDWRICGRGCEATGRDAGEVARLANRHVRLRGLMASKAGMQLD